MDVTIVLPIKNGARYLDEVMRAIFAQQTLFRYEVVVVDSGSTDGSDTIVQAYPLAAWRQIPPKEYNHGETRKFGASLGDPTSRYYVFLSQDATPMEGWLDALILPMEERADLAGTFSRHVPRADCHLPLVRNMTMEWPQNGTPFPILKRITDMDEFLNNKSHYCYFSDTSSAIRRSVFDDIPFRRVAFAEDVDWAERALLAGHAILYQPESRVLHSHSYPLWDQFTQNVDHGRAMRGTLGKASMIQWTPRLFGKYWWEYTRRHIIYIGLFPMRPRERLIWALFSAAWELATWGGNALGVNYDDLPPWFVQWFSHQRRVLRGKTQAGYAPSQPGPSPYISRSGRPF